MARKDITRSNAFKVIDKIEKGLPVKFGYNKSLYEFVMNLVNMYFENYKISFLFADEKYGSVGRVVYIEPNAILVRKPQYFDAKLWEV